MTKSKQQVSNTPTAELMIEIMKYVIKEQYYPNDYFYLIELQKDYSDDLIDDNEYDKWINDARIRWGLDKKTSYQELLDRNWRKD